VLSRVFKPDQNSYDERPTGESAVAAFMVGEDGRVILDSQVLSSCAWATGQALHDGRFGQDWPSQFRDAVSDFSEGCRDLVTAGVSAGEDCSSPQYIPRLLGHFDLDECLATAVDAAGTGAALSCAEIRISSQIVARRNADNPSGHEFLNSFIASDLGLVAEQAAKGDVGLALREYLRPQAEFPRPDAEATQRNYPPMLFPSPDSRPQTTDKGQDQEPK
jgi:hypothetical protein